MACRGVFYALTRDESENLLRLAGDTDALLDVVNTFYDDSREDAGFAVLCDKSWDAMHRCLSGGTLRDIGAGKTTLSLCVLGGANLYDGADHIICHVPAQKVQEVVKELDGVTETWFRDRYFSLNPRDYEGPIGEQDFEYTWSYFQEVRDLYKLAAKANRDVVFETDQ